MRIKTIVSGLLLVAGGAASAQAPAGVPPSQSTAEARGDKPDKMICKTQPTTGSLIKRSRICMRESDWARIADATNEAMDGILDDANQSHAVYANPIGFK